MLSLAVPDLPDAVPDLPEPLLSVPPTADLPLVERDDLPELVPVILPFASLLTAMPLLLLLLPEDALLEEVLTLE